MEPLVRRGCPAWAGDPACGCEGLSVWSLDIRRGARYVSGEEGVVFVHPSPALPDQTGLLDNTVGHFEKGLRKV